MNAALPVQQDVEEEMTSFMENYRKILSFIPVNAKVVYVDYATYANVGDMLIHKATENLLRDAGVKVLAWFTVDDHMALLRRRLPSDVTLLFQGGGNMTDVFPRHDVVRHRVLSAFPRNRAIILPQTVYYSTAEKLDRAAALYGRYANLTIFARDATSYDVLRKRFSNRIELAPDVAHYLSKASSSPPPTKDEPLYFMRRDQAHYAAVSAEVLARYDERRLVDWPDFLHAGERAAMRRFSRLLAVRQAALHNRAFHALWRLYRDRVIARAEALFAAHPRVVTNRLHGTIFGLNAGRPVDIVETGYGKLTAYAETWLSGFPGVRVLSDAVHERAMRDPDLRARPAAPA